MYNSAYTSIFSLIYFFEGVVKLIFNGDISYKEIYCDLICEIVY